MKIKGNGPVALVAGPFLVIMHFHQRKYCSLRANYLLCNKIAAMTASIKQEINDLVAMTTDEQLLIAVKVILSSQLPATGKKAKPIMKQMLLPNGRTVFVTPGDPSIDASELFGIWKDNLEIMENLRKTAWGGRA